MIAWSATWYGGEALAIAEPPLFRCRFCYRGFSGNLDGREVCEASQTIVHMDCHEDECVHPGCGNLICTLDRCDVLTDCEWCGSPRCDRHDPELHRSCLTL